MWELLAPRATLNSIFLEPWKHNLTSFTDSSLVHKDIKLKTKPTSIIQWTSITDSSLGPKDTNLKLHTNPTSITGTSLYNMDNYLYSSLGPKDIKPHTKLTPRFWIIVTALYIHCTVYIHTCTMLTGSHYDSYRRIMGYLYIKVSAYR